MPAFATWQSSNGESEIQKRGGETWASLSNFPRITEVYGCIKYYLRFSVLQNSMKFELQAKVRKDTPIPSENQLLFLIWVLQSVDPIQFDLDNTYTDLMHSAVMKK